MMCAWMNSSSESLGESSSCESRERSLLDCERKENAVLEAGGEAIEDADALDRDRVRVDAEHETVLGVRANFILERSSRWAA